MSTRGFMHPCLNVLDIRSGSIQKKKVREHMLINFVPNQISGSCNTKIKLTEMKGQ